MRHQIDLGEARHGDVPVLGFDRDVVLEQRPRFRPPIEAARESPLPAVQAAVDGAGADGAKLPFHGGRDREAALRPREPQGQQGFQPHRPGIPGCLPDRREDGHGLDSIGGDPPTPSGRRRHWRVRQERDGVFPMILRRGAEFV